MAQQGPAKPEGNTMFNAGHIAHDAVYRHAKGENITPATIKAELLESGATERQAVSQTKIVTALIPTVTTKSLRIWLKNLA